MTVAWLDKQVSNQASEIAARSLGLPSLEGGQVVYRTTPEEFASRLHDLVEAGARFVGGCCGTNPAFIKAMRRELSARDAGISAS